LVGQAFLAVVAGLDEDEVGHHVGGNEMEPEYELIGAGLMAHGRAFGTFGTEHSHSVDQPFASVVGRVGSGIFSKPVSFL